MFSQNKIKRYLNVCIDGVLGPASKCPDSVRNFFYFFWNPCWFSPFGMKPNHDGAVLLQTRPRPGSCDFWDLFTIRDIHTLAVFSTKFPAMERTLDMVSNNLASNTKISTEMWTVCINGMSYTILPSKHHKLFS